MSKIIENEIKQGEFICEFCMNNMHDKENFIREIRAMWVENGNLKIS